MRLALRIDPIGFAPCAALCAAIALIVLPADVHAQTARSPSSVQAEVADAARAPHAITDPNATLPPDTATGASRASGPLTANVPDTSAETASMNGMALDDHVLSRQRGGALGMVMVAATPPLLRGESGGRVTLWDEIGPPSPKPVPIDAARSAQSNIATYQRK